MSKNHQQGSIGVQLSEKPVDQMSEEELSEWLKGSPTRADVANYVSGFVDNMVTPHILQLVSKELHAIMCRNLVLQSFLISSGACTEQEITQAYESFLKNSLKPKEEPKESSK